MNVSITYFELANKSYLFFLHLFPGPVVFFQKCKINVSVYFNNVIAIQVSLGISPF